MSILPKAAIAASRRATREWLSFTSEVTRRLLLALRLDRRGGGVDLRLLARAGGDVGAGLDQAVHQGAADAGGAAEHDRGAAA